MANGVRQTSSGVVQTASGVAQTAVSSVSTIDSFEDSDLSEYSGDTGDYSITTTFATDGSNGLEQTGTSGSWKTIESHSGLDNYPSKGDEFHWDYEINYGGDSSPTALRHRFRWARQDTSSWNFYRFGVNMSTGDLTLVVVDSDTTTTLASETQSSIEEDENTHYQVQVQWDDGSSFGGSDGDIDVTLRDVDAGSDVTTLSGNDTTFSSGGIGIRTYLSDTGYRCNADHWRIL